MFYTTDSLGELAKLIHTGGNSVILVTGFFDLLHSEHIKFLQRAKLSGDILIVGVESDARARAVKGEGRPKETQAVRCRKVARYADCVLALGDDFNTQVAYESLIAVLKPAVYAVSSHTSYRQNKAKIVKKYGGKLVVVHKFNPAVSTTKLINQDILSP